LSISFIASATDIGCDCDRAWGFGSLTGTGGVVGFFGEQPIKIEPQMSTDEHR
jgi:hypothetical protein